MHSIRFWHGAAMAMVVVGALSVVTGLGTLAGDALPIQQQGAWIAVAFGVFVLTGSIRYLASTLHEAELPDDAREDLGLDAEE